MLKCSRPECGSRSVEVVYRWELKRISKRANAGSTPWVMGVHGTREEPDLWVELLRVINIVLRIVGRETEQFAYCHACGYTEKLKSEEELKRDA